MTDKPNSYVLGKGRLYFEPVRRPAMHLALGAGYEATVKLSEDIYEWFVNEALFDFRVISIVGYNPQMLLPAPPFERELRQLMDEWAAEQIVTPITEVVRGIFSDLTMNGEAAFSAPLYMAERIDFERNTSMMREDAEVLLIGDTAYEMLASIRKTMELDERWKQAVESKALDYMYATFIHESDAGVRKPVGKIELFDYDDHAIIVLEGSGELPGRMSISDALFQPKVQPLRGKQPSYLDHDPTKRHKRRKKK